MYFGLFTDTYESLFHKLVTQSAFPCLILIILQIHSSFQVSIPFDSPVLSIAFRSKTSINPLLDPQGFKGFSRSLQPL